MRNRYLASFIIAIVVLVAAAALITVGLVQSTPRMCTRDFGCFGSMQFSYCRNSSLGYVLVFLGGVCVIAGILLFILSEVIRSHEECCDCCDADFIDTANGYNCNCNCNCGDDCNCGCQDNGCDCECDCGCSDKEEKTDCGCGCAKKD